MSEPKGIPPHRGRKRSRSLVALSTDLLFNPQRAWVVQSLVLAGEAVLCLLIVRYVRFTNIDWNAYMQQVQLYIKGERDYTKIQGDTGPVVYPAGFIYVYTALHSLTDAGSNFRPAQYVFSTIYVTTWAIVFRLYSRARLPPYVYLLTTLSKRLHSIYVLRLFNDGIAMLLLHASVFLLCRRRWRGASVFFSLALSVKMNILLFAPGLGIVMLAAVGVANASRCAGIVLAIQMAMGLPFFLHDPAAYIGRAFEFSRKFLYIWTVNWRFVPERVFLSQRFAMTLLACHATLLVFAIRQWTSRFGGIIKFLRRCTSDVWRPAAMSADQLSPSFIVACLYSANAIGMLCARSLHYQFYCWEAHQLVFLLWNARIPTSLRLLTLLLIEICWETFPSTNLSSVSGLIGHAIVVWASIFRIPWTVV